MKYFEHEFFIIETTPEHDLIKKTWHNTNRMSDKTFRQAMLNYIAIHETNPSEKILVDSKKFFMPVSVSTQKWIDDTIAPRQVALGLRYMAFVYSNKYISQLSIEQAVDEQTERPFIVRFFDDTDEAINWLKIH